MSDIRKESAQHNQSILIKDLGLFQKGNTSIYTNQKFFVLSPSIRNKLNWFDLRKVIIEQIETIKMQLLIIRFHDNYMLVDLKVFLDSMIDENPFNTKNSGIHWKFKIKKEEQNKWFIYNQRSLKKYFVDEIDKQKLIENINNQSLLNLNIHT